MSWQSKTLLFCIKTDLWLKVWFMWQITCILWKPGLVVKIFKKVYLVQWIDRQTTDAKWWQKLTWPLARWTKNVVKIKTVIHLGWVPFKIASDSPALHLRWQPLLKIEISFFFSNIIPISYYEKKYHIKIFFLLNFKHLAPVIHFDC
jgi:hypothetical protein